MDVYNHSVLDDYGEKPQAWQTPLGILMVPLFSKAFYDRIMSFLVSLGIGALSGSIMFIMLPQAFRLEDMPNENYFYASAITLGALYFFFFIDRIVQYIMEWRRRATATAIHKSTLKLLTRCSSEVCEPTYPSAIPILCEPCKDEISIDQSTKMAILESNDATLVNEMKHLTVDMEVSEISNALVRRLSSRRAVPVIRKIRSGSLSSRSRSTTGTPDTSPTSVGICELKVPREEDTVDVSVAVVDELVVSREEIEVATVAYMIIFGSAANNFVDGMSNGVAFGDSLVRGLSVGLACIAQQFPQELGLLAILVQSGLGIKRTLLLDLIPAVLSYLGFIIGARLDNFIEHADNYVFAVSAGMYLYVFLGTLIPEVRDSTNTLIKTDLKNSLLATALQATGIALGTVFMFFMSKYGSRINI
uniref:Zinc transporter ZIP14 n=1 Tax=Parascaris univalens TaxID=6257 RepID=A0A915A7D1_PARUN